MPFVNFALQALRQLGRTLAYGWALDAADIFKRAWALIQVICRRLKLPHPVREEFDPDC